MFFICKSMFLTSILKNACTHLLIFFLFFLNVTYYVELLLLLLFAY